MILVSTCSCLCPSHWSQVLSREWRCSWSSADRRCSNYIWVIDNFITFYGASYIRDLTVVQPLWISTVFGEGPRDWHHSIKYSILWSVEGMELESGMFYFIFTHFVQGWFITQSYDGWHWYQTLTVKWVFEEIWFEVSHEHSCMHEQTFVERTPL